MLSGTEADILNSVARLRKATRNQIRKEIGFSLSYVDLLCRYLIRKGYLVYTQGHYYLAKEGIKSLLSEGTPKIDRGLIKEVADEVAKEISGELKKTVKGIRIPVSIRGAEREEKTRARQNVKIKTDFDFPVEDETLALESNINKIGAHLEKEKSDIDRSVELFKKMQKRGRGQ